MPSIRWSPVGAQIDKTSDVEFEAVPVDRVLAEQEDADVSPYRCRLRPWRPGLR
jgi:hypothetical protein